MYSHVPRKLDQLFVHWKCLLRSPKNYGRQLICHFTIKTHVARQVKLHSTCTQILPAYKVPNDISMANINFNTVAHLVSICSVQILPESCFNARTVLKKLLNTKMILIGKTKGDETYNNKTSPKFPPPHGYKTVCRLWQNCYCNSYFLSTTTLGILTMITQMHLSTNESMYMYSNG